MFQIFNIAIYYKSDKKQNIQYSQPSKLQQITTNTSTFNFFNNDKNITNQIKYIIIII